MQNQAEMRNNAVKNSEQYQKQIDSVPNIVPKLGFFAETQPDVW